MNRLKEIWIELAQQYHLLLVGLISVSLISLLGIQAYWIHTDLSLQEDRLNEKMQDVLLDMHHMIEDDSLLSRHMIDLFATYEQGQNLPASKVKRIRRETSQMMDSVLQAHFLSSLDYEYTFYHTVNKEVIFTSTPGEIVLANFEEYSERAGWRVREALGKGIYRFGIFFNNKFWYLLQQTVWLLGLSLLLGIVLIGSFMSTLLVLDKQRRMTRMHNDFINNLAHELKTPVFASSVIFKIIRQHQQKGNFTKLDEPLQLLEQENKLLLDKIEKVLDFSTFEEGVPKLDMQSVDMHPLIQETVATYRYQAKARGGSLQEDLRAEDSEILGDPRHLQNLLHNLLDNAMKYSGDQLHIRIATRAEKGYLLLVVEDQGIGMSEEEQYHVFDKFYRASQGDAHDTKGFGLGLSYVRKIAALHGGQVRVKSSKGEGSCFTLAFPLKQNSNQPETYARYS